MSLVSSMRIMFGMAVLAALLYGGYHVLVVKDDWFGRHARLREQIVRHAQMQHKLQRHIAGLHTMVHGLTGSPFVQEQYVRQTLMMGRPSELVYLFEAK